jgi:hypothetical protein
VSLYYSRAGEPMTLGEWAATFEESNQVAFDEVAGIKVSTVWIGLDHNFLSAGPPLIFETMVFGGAHDEFCDRYSTEEQAKAGHRRVLAALREGRKP